MVYQPWLSSMSSCGGHSIHYPMASMGSDVNPSAKCMWSSRYPCLLHATQSLHPSFGDALADIHRRSHNFPLIHPREVLLAWHQVIARPWFIMKTLPGWLLEHNSLLILELIYMMFALWNPDDMCYKTWEPVFIYTMKARLIYQSTALGAVVKTKWYDHMTSPFLRIYYMAILYTIYWGCMWQCTMIQGLWTVRVNSS